MGLAVSLGDVVFPAAAIGVPQWGLVLWDPF